jgi:hypothetical protein
MRVKSCCKKAVVGRRTTTHITSHHTTHHASPHTPHHTALFTSLRTSSWRPRATPSSRTSSLNNSRSGSTSCEKEGERRGVGGRGRVQCKTVRAHDGWLRCPLHPHFPRSLSLMPPPPPPPPTHTTKRALTPMKTYFTLSFIWSGSPPTLWCVLIVTEGPLKDEGRRKEEGRKEEGGRYNLY